MTNVPLCEPISHATRARQLHRLHALAIQLRIGDRNCADRDSMVYQQHYDPSPSCVPVVRSTNPEEGVRNTEVDEGISLRTIVPAS